MSRSRSSKRWLQEHFNDNFVQQAQQQGYRSRAVFKLLEINDKDKLIKPGMTIVDLGAAPGGWSQVASQIVGKKGRVFALDILEMDELPGVDFIQGDFTEDAVAEKLLSQLDDKIDLVISDMSPNISGVVSSDQPRAMYLAELALDFARQVLKPGGSFLTKIFQGQGTDDYLRELRRDFAKVVVRKPAASRGRSREQYYLAKAYKN